MIISISGKISSGKDAVGKIIKQLTSTYPYEKALEGLIERNAPVVTEYNPNIDKFEIKKFADKLKDIVCFLIGCTREQLEDQEFKNKELGEEWWYCQFKDTSNGKIWRENLLTHEEIQNYLNTCTNRTVSDGVFKPTARQLLQEIGTEAMRDVIHPNIWVNALMSEYKGVNHWSYLQEPTKEEYEKDKIYPNWIITDMRFPNELQAVKQRNGITIRVNRKPDFWKDDEWTEEMIKWHSNQHPSETALDNHSFDYVIDNDGSISDLIDKVKEILVKEKII
jgi:hypothetical protein